MGRHASKRSLSNCWTTLETSSQTPPYLSRGDAKTHIWGFAFIFQIWQFHIQVYIMEPEEYQRTWNSRQELSFYISFPSFHHLLPSFFVMIELWSSDRVLETKSGAHSLLNVTRCKGSLVGNSFSSVQIFHPCLKYGQSIVNHFPFRGNLRLNERSSAQVLKTTVIYLTYRSSQQNQFKAHSSSL